MKTIKKTKPHKVEGFLIVSIVVAMVLGLFACTNQASTDSKEKAENINDAMIDNNKAEDDAQFLVNVAEINLMEIQLGNLAAERGTMTEVKDLGKMMADAHTKNMEELKDLASKKSIVIPTSLTNEGQDAFKKLSEKSGNDFDKEYCDMTVDGHKDAVDKFEKASNKAADEEIKHWAETTLPALKKHLEQAVICQEHCKKM